MSESTISRIFKDVDRSIQPEVLPRNQLEDMLVGEQLTAVQIASVRGVDESMVRLTCRDGHRLLGLRFLNRDGTTGCATCREQRGELDRQWRATRREWLATMVKRDSRMFSGAP